MIFEFIGRSLLQSVRGVSLGQQKTCELGLHLSSLSL